MTQDFIHKKLVIAIPCFNEAENLRSVLIEIPKQIPGIDEVVTLVIDDGSTDNTASVALGSGASVIRHGLNRGLGVAFSTAVDAAIESGAFALVGIDGDGQFSPSDIGRLLEPILQDQADMVTGSRFCPQTELPQGISAVKLWGNRQMARLISQLTSQKFYDVSCGFRAYSWKTLINLNLMGHFTYTQETFLDITFKGLRVTEVPIRVTYFKERKSRVAQNLIKYAFNTSKIIIRAYRDQKPLRFFWYLGGITGFLAAILITYFFFRFWETGAMRGNLWAGFLGGASFFVALLLFLFGLAVDLLDRIRITLDRHLALTKFNSYYVNRVKRRFYNDARTTKVHTPPDATLPLP